MRFGQMLMHRFHHARGIVRPGDREHRRVRFPDQIGFETQATRDDDLAVLGQRLADGAQRLLDRRVDEAAGVDDDEVGAGVVGRGDVALGPELGEDPFRVYKCLGTAEGNEPDFRAFYRDRLAEGSPGTGSR